MRILLIEDNEDDICLLRNLLLKQTEGSMILNCADRLSVGLTTLAHGETDVVLLDLSLTDRQDSKHSNKSRHRPRTCRSLC